MISAIKVRKNPKAKRSARRRLGQLRLIFGFFVALLLPLSQATIFAHVITDEQACHFHSLTNCADSLHHTTTSHPEEHSHPAEHSPESEHHTATDHFDGFHVWKPNSKIFLAAFVAIVTTPFKAFVIVPRAVNITRVEKQHWQSAFSGPPPQLRAPPTLS